MSQQQNAGRQLMVQGRIVWVSGDLFKGKGKTDQNTRQPIIDTKTGLQKIEYGFGLAVPIPDQTRQSPEEFQKVSANFNAVWAAIHEEAYSLYPSRQLPPTFAMKYKDGNNGIDQDGKPYSARTGYAGHIVFSCTTSIPIKFFKWDNGANVQINEGIKCGDYVNVQLSIKAHPAVGQGKPGLYLNPNAVQFLGFGEAIVNVPSGDQMFGASAPALPPGASSTPVAPPGMLVPQGAPQYAQPQQPAYGQPPQQTYAPPAPPQQPAAPHWGVLPPIHQPQQPAAAPAMPTPQQFAPPPVQQMVPPPGLPPVPGYR